jgi:hypothetical protein
MCTGSCGEVCDKLQKSYQQLGNALGFSKQQVRDAIERLEHAGLITKELRNFPTKGGVMLTDVMFLEPVPNAIERLTFTPMKAEELQADPDEAIETNDDEAVTPRPYGPGTTPYVPQTISPGPQTTPSLPVDHTYTDHDRDYYKEHNKDPLPCSRRGEAKAFAEKGEQDTVRGRRTWGSFRRVSAAPGEVAPGPFLLQQG